MGIRRWGRPQEQLQLLVDDINQLLKEDLNYIILDYPFSYQQKQVAPYIDLSIFIDTPLDLCLARRILRDFSSAAGQDICHNMTWYINRGRPSYCNSVKMGKMDADLIIDGALPPNQIIQTLKKAIKTMG